MVRRGTGATRQKHYSSARNQFFSTLETRFEAFSETTMNDEEVFFNFQDDRDWDPRLSVTSTPTRSTRSVIRSTDEDSLSFFSELDYVENRDMYPGLNDPEAIERALDDLLSGPKDSPETDPFQLDIPLNPHSDNDEDDGPANDNDCFRLPLPSPPLARTAVTNSPPNQFDETNTFLVPQLPPWRLNKSDNHDSVFANSPSEHIDRSDTFIAPQTPPWRLNKSDNHDSLIYSPSRSSKLTDTHVSHQKQPEQLNGSAASILSTDYSDEITVVQQNSSRENTEFKNRGESSLPASPATPRRTPVMYQIPSRPPLRMFKMQDHIDIADTSTQWIDVDFENTLVPWAPWLQDDQNVVQDTAVDFASPTDFIEVAPPVYYRYPSLSPDELNDTNGFAYKVTAGVDFDVEQTPVQGENSSFQQNENNIQDAVPIRTYAADFTPDYEEEADGIVVEKTSVEWQHSSFPLNRSEIRDVVPIRTYAADFTPDYGEDVSWQPDRPFYGNNNRIVTDTAYTTAVVDWNAPLQTDEDFTPAYSFAPDMSWEPNFSTGDYDNNEMTFPTSAISLTNSPIVSEILSSQLDESDNQAADFAITAPTVFTRNKPPVWHKSSRHSKKSSHRCGNKTSVTANRATSLTNSQIIKQKFSLQPNTPDNRDFVEEPTFIDSTHRRAGYPLRLPNGKKPNENVSNAALRYIMNRPESMPVPRVPDIEMLTELQSLTGTKRNALLKRRQLFPSVMRVSKNKWRILKWIAPVPRKFYMLPIDLQRPPLSYMTLACLAVQNSPTRYITLPEAYAFVLHHFRYYRYVTDHWKTSIRTCLGKKMFIERDACGKKEKIFGYEEEFDWEKIFKRGELHYMNSQDTRGSGFFNKMLRGELGLPRQLFYNAIALQMPFFAGPENSALFYHLLGMKHTPDRFAPLFREYWLYEHSGNEPTFVEEHCHTDNRHSLLIGDFNSYGEALDVGDVPEMMTAEQIVSFHDNVEAYFKLQKEYEEQGVARWKTPKFEEVERVVIGGGAESEYCLPRAVEDLPLGTVYKKDECLPLPPQYEEQIAKTAGSNGEGNEEPLAANEKNVSADTLQPTWFVVGGYRKPKPRVKKRPIEVDPKEKALEAWATNFSEPYHDPVAQGSPIVAKMVRRDGEESMRPPEPGESSFSTEESFEAETTMIRENQSFDPSSISLF